MVPMAADTARSGEQQDERHHRHPPPSACPPKIFCTEISGPGGDHIITALMIAPRKGCRIQKLAATARR